MVLPYYTMSSAVRLMISDTFPYYTTKFFTISNAKSFLKLFLNYQRQHSNWLKKITYLYYNKIMSETFNERVDNMSKQQKLERLIPNIPDNKLDIVLAFVEFILNHETEVNNSLLSEPSLAKDWMTEEEDAAWENL